MSAHTQQTKYLSREIVPSEKVHNLGVENSTVVQVSRIDGDVYVDLMRKNKINSTVKTSIARPGNFGTDPDPDTRIHTSD